MGVEFGPMVWVDSNRHCAYFIDEMEMTPCNENTADAAGKPIGLCCAFVQERPSLPAVTVGGARPCLPFAVPERTP